MISKEAESKKSKAKSGSDVFAGEVIPILSSGLHRLRKRSNGGLGALEDGPQSNSNGIHVRGASTPCFCTRPLSSSRAARECEATRPGETAFGGDRPPAPLLSAGRLPSPQASQTKGSGRAGRCPLLSAGCGQNGESCREEERGTQKA
jgi:hypothetical protein